MCAGVLYVVSTPIGNMDDITLRAIKILNEAECIVSEDTRETQKILRFHNIEKPQISYRDQNHDRVYVRILELLKSGSNIALTSDSGTPLISDPGFKLVRELIKDGIKVVSVPGPSAFVSAITVAGIPPDKFAFLGFLPKSSGQRKLLLEKYGDLESSLVIYESPYRIEKLLREVVDTLGNRYIVLARELTKVYEEVMRGNVSDILDEIEGKNIKGEFVVIISKEGYVL